jgi:polyisoprenoid-binding protein YceI
LYAQKFVLQHAVVSFQIENAGITVNGKFDSIPSIIMTMNNNIVTNLNLSGSIAAHSINTGIGIRDKHLKKSDYFDVAQFPRIYLASTNISGNGAVLAVYLTCALKKSQRPFRWKYRWFKMDKLGCNRTMQHQSP